jgi:hypothetical protein
MSSGYMIAGWTQMEDYRNHEILSTHRAASFRLTQVTNLNHICRCLVFGSFRCGSSVGTTRNTPKCLLRRLKPRLIQIPAKILAFRIIAAQHLKATVLSLHLHARTTQSCYQRAGKLNAINWTSHGGSPCGLHTMLTLTQKVSYRLLQRKMHS